MDLRNNILEEPTPFPMSADEKTSDNGSPTKITKVTVNLLKLIEKTGYRLVQINGQRRFGGPPPNWEGPPPPKGSEIFVGKIPRDCYEDELVPVFETVSQIYELRLMMDFSGSNRGFAFVMYMSPEIADLAVQKLNNYEIREGKRIGVVKSVNNCKLFIGGLPADKREEDIKCVLCRLTEGVTEIWLYKNTACPGNKSQPTVQYAIVEYDSHRSAAMARRRLIPERVQLWGREIIVDWATPQNRTKPGDRDFCNEFANINEKRHFKKHSLVRNKAHSSGQVSDSGFETLSSRSSSIWSLEQAMDNALYGISNFDSSQANYIHEYNTDASEELVKTILPNVHDLSPSEIEAITSVIMKTYKNVTEEPSVATNQNCLKPILGSRLGETSQMFKEINTKSYDSHHRCAVKGCKLQQDLHGENLFLKDSFDMEENIDPRQILQEARLEQSYQSCRTPLEHLFPNQPSPTFMQLPDYMNKNENQKYCPMSIQERTALSELRYGQSNIFSNTGECSRLKNNVRVMGQIPIEKMNNLQISGSKAIAYSPKSQTSPLSWLGKETSTIQEFVPSVMIHKNSLANDTINNINNIWEDGKSNAHIEEDIFIAANDVTESGNAYSTPWSQNQNTVGNIGFIPASLFNSDIEGMKGNSSFTSPIKNQSSLPSWNSDISKENCSASFDNNSIQKLGDFSVGEDTERHLHNFNRAPGGPVRNNAKLISQSKAVCYLSSPYKRIF